MSLDTYHIVFFFSNYLLITWVDGNFCATSQCCSWGRCVNYAFLWESGNKRQTPKKTQQHLLEMPKEKKTRARRSERTVLLKGGVYFKKKKVVGNCSVIVFYNNNNKCGCCGRVIRDSSSTSGTVSNCRILGKGWSYNSVPHVITVIKHNIFFAMNANLAVRGGTSLVQSTVRTFKSVHM